MSTKAIYAGTFDPLTLGHCDLIERASGLFSKLVLAVAANPRKDPLFTIEERIAMANQVVKSYPGVTVDAFSGLLVDYARSNGIKMIVRGLRAFSDFEFEFQMALTNRRLAPDIETIFLMPSESYSYISSTSVREIAELQGDVSHFVPPAVVTALNKKFKITVG